MDRKKLKTAGELEPRAVPPQFHTPTTETVPTVPEVSFASDIPHHINVYTNESIPLSNINPDTYAIWKQKIPQQQFHKINHAQISNPKKQFPIASHMINGRETITRDSPVKKSSEHSPNSYTKDSRLKFYQKVASDPIIREIQTETTSNQLKCVQSSPLSANHKSQTIGSTDLITPTQFEVSKSEQLKRNYDHHLYQSANEGIIQQLLCLVQSQNAQIQLLQAQVETLLSVHNENARQLNEYPKVPIPVHNVSTNTADLVSQNSQTRKLTKETSKFEENQRDEKNQKMIKEKKVSIGVMTSFELTVQDSVIYNVDNASRNIEYSERVCDSGVNRNQQLETLAFVKNTPRGKLEQIVEDSESHLSSALQANNNYRTCSSVKKSLQVNPDLSRFEQLPQPNWHPANKEIVTRINEIPINNVSRSASPANLSLQVENAQPNPLSQGKHPPVQEIQSPELQVIPLTARDDVDSADPVNQKKTPKVGWTLYDNVMCQVNDILHNTRENEGVELKRSVEVIPELDKSKLFLNELQQSTIEQLKLFGLTLAENSGYSGIGSPLNISKKFPLDTSYYPRLDYQANFMQSSNSGNDSSTSLHMKALASKYLGIKQLPNISTHQKGIELISSMVVNNIQNNEVPRSDNDPQYQRLQKALPDCKNRDNYLINAKRNPQNILDISSLKRQPKLL